MISCWRIFMFCAIMVFLVLRLVRCTRRQGKVLHMTGILASQLQAYEELGLSKATVIRLAICCPSLLIGNVNKEFAQIIEKLKHLSIEQDWIRSYLLDNTDIIGRKCLT
uniref:Uncharacterized protein n=1 Tax=Nelumbo nucifera TaxID=4432 RepID=A0A822Z1D2_NELNU|nr:TPA_asm: hypothetical protein HUJ06_012899 [Nelumbo nucifera]